MKCKLLLIILISITFIGCWVKSKEKQSVSDRNDRYFEYLKVNNDLTLSGVNELSGNKLEGKEYYHFTYKNGKLKNIKSYSSLAKSFHELNKYIFNVNKEWKEININSSSNTIEYSFTNDVELIKFIISYNDKRLPSKFQVLPFNITYDNYNILGKTIVCSGEFLYNKEELLEKILWIDSNTEYRYIYNKKGYLTTKSIYHNESTLYEYRFDLDKYGIFKGIE